MKLFPQTFYEKFSTSKKVVEAYFQCFIGIAQEIIFNSMSPTSSDLMTDTKSVLQALDNKFFDYNIVTNTKQKYVAFKMTQYQTYNEFHTVFTKLVNLRNISQNRCFEDLYEKITPILKELVITKRSEMSDSYKVFDKFFAIFDRGWNSIQAKKRQIKLQ